MFVLYLYQSMSRLRIIILSFDSDCITAGAVVIVCSDKVVVSERTSRANRECGSLINVLWLHSNTCTHDYMHNKLLLLMTLKNNWIISIHSLTIPPTWSLHRRSAVGSQSLLYHPSCCLNVLSSCFLRCNSSASCLIALLSSRNVDLSTITYKSNKEYKQSKM